jgi:hypothetical protein
MNETTSGIDAARIPMQEAGHVNRHLARVIEQSIHPEDTASAAVPPRHRAETPVHEPSVTPGELVARVYDTPVWVPTQGGPPQEDPARGNLATDPIVETDAPDAGWTLVRDREDLLRHARWRTPRSGRAAIGLLLVAVVLAAFAIGSGLLDQQSTPTLALALTCLLAASGLYAILVATTPTVVQLDEAVLTVRHHGRTDRFELNRPYQDVRVSGQPGTAKWLLCLGCPDGRTVVLTGSMVDSQRLAPVVSYAQEYAQRGRDAREERFNR